jgi:hypothetical protein
MVFPSQTHVTMDPDIIDHFFLVCSDIVRTVEIPWLAKHNLQPFIDPDYPQHLETFAGEIHPDNTTEALC